VLALALPFVLLAGSREHHLNSKLTGKMNQAVNNEVAAEEVPGTVVGVWIGDRGWVTAIGESDVDTHRRIKPDDTFRIESITKTFTATVLLQLVDEHRLALDDKARKYLPKMAGLGAVTVRELLNQTSGLFDFNDDPEFHDAVLSNSLRKWSPVRLVEIALSHPRLSAPGRTWHYSNTNYIVLGLIIEKLTGRKLEEEIQKRIIEPLGLKHTGFPKGPALSGNYIHGYIGPVTPYDFTEVDPSAGWAASGMVSNLQDLKKWAKALARGELVSAAMQKQRVSLVRSSPDSEEMKYGLGIANIRGFLGHWGDAFGYNSIMFYLPAKDITVIVLVNWETEDSQAADDIFMSLSSILLDEVSVGAASKK
jgi:D-alanyl-D-alanine carboxypeptidase